MKSNYLLLSVLLFLALVNLPKVSGQYSLNDTLEIDEAVITGTKTLRNIKEVPGRISVIKSEAIEFSPAQQVDDILRFTTGLNVNRSTGIYSQRPMVTLRGLSGDEQSRTLVLMNGVPINTSDEGGVNWNRINQNDVQRIEIFKGPGSSLYGNNAMGGVINIITKKPHNPQEIYGGISYGTFHTLRQDLNVRIRTDKGYYATISQYYLKSDGYNNVPEDKRTPYDIARKLEEIALSARAGNDFNNWFKWELQYDIFRDKRGEGTMIIVPEGVYRNFNTNLFRGNLRGGNDKTNYDFNAFYQMENYYDVNERFRGPNYSRYDVNSFREDLGGIFNINHDLFNNNTVTAGFEIKQGSIEGGDYYQTPRIVNESNMYDTIYNAGTISIMAAYIQDEHAFLENKINLVVGLRFDHVTFDDGEYHSTDPWNTIPELKKHTWTEFSPRVGLRFNFIDEISSYVSYSHGFRASILDDLTRTGWMWVGPKYANPELGPETLDNFEIGADVIPSPDIKLTVSAYYATGKDFLYYVATNDSLFGRPIYRRENVTNVTLNGFETSAEYSIYKGVNIRAAYTFADSKIDAFNERPELENKYLKYVPRHTASLSLFWRNDIVNASILGLYKGEQFGDDANTVTLDPYVTIDVQLSKQIKENYILSLDIHDLFDNKHMETIEYISPGRVITARAAIRF